MTQSTQHLESYEINSRPILNAANVNFENVKSAVNVSGKGMPIKHSA